MKEKVSTRSSHYGTLHVYQNLKKSCYHGVALLLFDGLIFLVKRDGFWQHRWSAFLIHTLNILQLGSSVLLNLNHIQGLSSYGVFMVGLRGQLVLESVCSRQVRMMGAFTKVIESA